MPSGLTIRIKGLEELDAKMLQMKNALGFQRLQDMCLESVTQMRNLAAANVRSHKDTGTLEKSLIAAPSKSRTHPGAWTKAAWATAPHAHLIEFGHRIVGHKPNKIDTGKVARAFAFFRPAVDALRAKTRADITATIRSLLSGASR